MAAYVMIDRLAVTDPAAFDAYRTPALAGVRIHGGRHVLPLGVQIEPMEGTWKPSRSVLIVVEAAEQAERW